MQDSGGIYLTNIDKYFKEFNQSVLIYPLRDLMGYVAAEKVRYARRFFGSRRFAFPQLPNYFVKKFNHYDIEAQIKGGYVRLLEFEFFKKNIIKIINLSCIAIMNLLQIHKIQ